jgi:hypothetical protein
MVLETVITATDYASDIHRWAGRALGEMASAGVLPTPANFDLWYRYVNGSDRNLSRRITAKLKENPAMSPGDLEALHADFPTPQAEVAEAIVQTDAIQEAAQTLVDDVTNNGEHLRRYGNALSQWTTKLGQTRSMENLARL